MISTVRGVHPMFGRSLSVTQKGDSSFWVRVSINNFHGNCGLFVNCAIVAVWPNTARRVDFTFDPPKLREMAAVTDWCGFVYSLGQKRFWRDGDGPAFDCSALCSLCKLCWRTNDGAPLIDWLRESSLPVIPGLIETGEFVWPYGPEPSVKPNSPENSTRCTGTATPDSY